MDSDGAASDAALWAAHDLGPVIVSADDVRRLVEIVRAAVAERTGVELATELRLAGFEAER